MPVLFSGALRVAKTNPLAKSRFNSYYQFLRAETKPNLIDKMKSDFLARFATLTQSSARVLFVPTEETYRAAEALREYASLNGILYKEHDIIHGWREFKPGQPLTFDALVDTAPALTASVRSTGASSELGSQNAARWMGGRGMPATRTGGSR